jgi:hypothetical protein
MGGGGKIFTHKKIDKCVWIYESLKMMSTPLHMRELCLRFFNYSTSCCSDVFPRALQFSFQFGF